ncbi:MAG TPA: hypothetical protein VIM14_09155, partial [Polyangia bacterium]
MPSPPWGVCGGVSWNLAGVCRVEAKARPNPDRRPSGSQPVSGCRPPAVDQTAVSASAAQTKMSGSLVREQRRPH